MKSGKFQRTFAEKRISAAPKVALLLLALALPAIAIAGPPTIVFPVQLQDQDKRDSCTKGYPQDASGTSLIPLSLLHRMYP
jgi:hypothetical protein